MYLINQRMIGESEALNAFLDVFFPRASKKSWKKSHNSFHCTKHRQFSHVASLGPEENYLEFYVKLFHAGRNTLKGEKKIFTENLRKPFFTKNLLRNEKRDFQLH